MNKGNKTLNDKELEKVNGGVGGICGFNDITIGDITGKLTSEPKDKEPTSNPVGFFPGLSGFP